MNSKQLAWNDLGRVEDILKTCPLPASTSVRATSVHIHILLSESPPSESMINIITQTPELPRESSGAFTDEVSACLLVMEIGIVILLHESNEFWILQKV